MVLIRCNVSFLNFFQYVFMVFNGVVANSARIVQVFDRVFRLSDRT